MLLNDINMGDRVAIIGSRGIQDWLDQQIVMLANHIVAHEGKIITGGAPGADQAAIRGSDFTAEVYLPWMTFEEHALAQVANKSVAPHYGDPIVDKHIEYYYNQPIYTIKQSVIKLMSRNYTIIQRSEKVVAFPRMSHGEPTGGTAFGIYIAKLMGKPLYMFPVDTLSKWDICGACGLHKDFMRCGAPFHDLKAYGAA